MPVAAPVKTSPTAQATAGKAVCHRCSFVRSAWAQTAIIAMTATIYGTEVNKPIVGGLATPVCLMMVGSQKLTI